MKTYLIFFGKSQYFTTHAFDSHDYIEDFNTVIKDFDLLESKVFTVDDIENQEMLAKYNFTSREGKNYSLLKLYSFAQAFSGDRIDGSIFGVALLSEAELKLSKTNFAILSSAKTNFAKLSLNGFKFKSSDFYDEVYKIWNAFVIHKEGNYLEKVEFTNRNITGVNQDTKGFYVKNLFEDAIDLNDKIYDASRIYISEDLAHLKRTHDRWGNDFKIYAKVNNAYEIYKEPITIDPFEDDEDDEHLTPEEALKNKIFNLEKDNQKLEYKISDLEEENQLLVDEVNHNQRKNKRTILQLGLLASLLFVTTVSFFFKTYFFSDKKDAEPIEPMGNIAEAPKPYDTDTININAILANPDNVDSLSNFIKNVKIIQGYNPEIELSDSAKFKNAYQKLTITASNLNLNISSLTDKYSAIEKSIDSILIQKQKQEAQAPTEQPKKKKKNETSESKKETAESSKTTNKKSKNIDTETKK